MYQVTCHENVTSFSFQPIGDYVVTGSDDGCWSLHDIKHGQLLTKVEADSAVTAIEFHPDGLVLGVGLDNGKVIVYDIRT